ncbi:MAG: carbohydrate kinase family protein [Deltaproteobacteria bacterium]|nr:MAG: carbohydrate kinase family protein [Deltaproteobacteria bacterium]
MLGGNGGATAYLLGRLGEQVSLNSQVGTDALGTLVRGWLEEAGITLVGPPAKTTAVDVVMLSPRGKRRWVYYTGEKVVWKRSLEVSEAEWFFASGYGQVTSEDLRELVEVFEVFRSGGTKVVFDPGPWFFATVRREEMLLAWQQVDCLIGTEAELSTWHSYKTVEELIEQLLDQGPNQVVVKRAGAGAAFGGRNQGIASLPTERVKAANTVGVGDTFNAGLLHGLCRGETLEKAVRIGLRLATQAVKKGRGVLGALG